MIATLSSSFTLTITSPDDARVVTAVYEVTVEIAGMCDALGQIDARTSGISHASIEAIWEHDVLLRVPNSRSPEGLGICTDNVSPPFPPDPNPFLLAQWVVATMANHDWLEGPPVDHLSGNLACGFSADRVRTTLLTSVSVGRVSLSGRASVVHERMRVDVEDMKQVGIRKPWISHQ